MDGVFDLAQMLTGGGAAARETAFYDTQRKIGQNQHLSAQTQQALEQAKVAQLDARKAEMEIEATEQEADAYLATGAAKDAAEARALATLARAGRGNFPQLMQGRGAVQEQGFLADVANPEADLATRLGASSGLTKKVQLAPEGPTPQVSNFAFREGLSPDAQTRFDASAPEKFVSVGGVPYSVRTGNPLVDPATAASNAGAIAGAKTGAQGMAKRTLDLPQARTRLKTSTAKLDLLDDKISRITDNEKLWTAVGVGRPLALIPGTEAAYLKAQLESLKYNLRFTMLQDLRDNSKTGGAVGNVSNEEGRALENALAALDFNLRPEDLREQLGVLRDYFNGSKSRLTDAFLETYPELAGATSGAVPASRPAQSGIKFLGFE